VRLWALDRSHPDLERWTLDEGPGLRLALLNRLYATLPASFAGYVVLSDDDYLFSRGSLQTALSVALAAGLDLAGAAQDHRSAISHRITLGRLLSLARLTTFVEIGPLVIVAPAWRRRILPLPEEYGMGTGLDAVWPELREEGCRLGLLDGVLIRHLQPPSKSYDASQGLELFHSLVALRGGYHTSLRTISTWRPWQSAPPWLAARSGATDPLAR
jgi:hypothetical protein